jgi:hypothetical protein
MGGKNDSDFVRNKNNIFRCNGFWSIASLPIPRIYQLASSKYYYHSDINH